MAKGVKREEPKGDVMGKGETRRCPWGVKALARHLSAKPDRDGQNATEK